jgi:fatty acid desaturase
MYTFVIKENIHQLSNTIYRGLLLFIAILIYFTPPAVSIVVSYIAFFLLLVIAIFIHILQIKYPTVHKIVIIIASAILLFTTVNWLLASIVVVLNFVIHSFKQSPTIKFEEDGFTLKKPFNSKKYTWDNCSNIIAKDGLLTIDFNNNHLLQLPIDENKSVINIDAFNNFVSQKIEQVSIV